MNLSTKYLSICILFWGLGTLSLFIGLYTLVTGEGPTGVKLLAEKYSNPLIKYSIPLLFISGTVPLFAYPILVFKGIVTIDYHNSSKKDKAKSNFIIATMSLPFVFFICFPVFAEGCEGGINCSKALTIFLVFCGFYSHTIYSVIKY